MDANARAKDCMTKHARQAETLANVFEAKVKDVFREYRVDMTRPDLSTMGGVRALQHIRLVTRHGFTFVIGSAHVGKRTARLRTLASVVALTERRFGEPMPIPPAEYARLLDVATKLFGEFGLAITIVEQDDPETPNDSGGFPASTSSRPPFGPPRASTSAPAPAPGDDVDIPLVPLAPKRAAIFAALSAAFALAAIAWIALQS
jgi:hypothetical protein